MAKIIGAVAASHTPTIGFAFDTNKQEDPVWKPIFQAFKPVQDWLAAKKPDVLFVIFNDHVTSFFFDHYSAFALGIGDSYAVADEGGGARDLPPLKGHTGLSHHIGQALVADEFDMSFFQGKPLDHGMFSPLSVMVPHKPAWPAQVVPLQIGVLQFPIPSAKRCFKLGQSLRKAIESYPEDLKVAIVATGGLSHQVHGERAGFNNVKWDDRFLDLFENDPEALTRMTIADYAKLGGMEGSEIIMWLVMRGAMSAKMKCLHRDYYLPSMTGIATAVYENELDSDDVLEPVADIQSEYRRHIGHQLAGVEQLEGTDPFTLERSVKGYRLNTFLHDLVDPVKRKAFKTDEEKAYEAYKLTPEERELVRKRDWKGMIHYGVIFFMLEKLGAVIGVSNLHIYAAMRGQTLEEFQKTRNTQVLYSVAGKEGGKQEWDKAKAN
jgi:gallate dioxygenase